MKVYIDFDDVICEMEKHFTKLVKQLFGIDVPYSQVQFFDLLPSENFVRYNGWQKLVRCLMNIRDNRTKKRFASIFVT